MKLTKKVVMQKLENNSPKIKKFGVKKIGLFGSILKNKQKRSSDIDFLVEFNKTTFDNYAEVLILLENIFKRKIDLVTKSSLRPEFSYIIKETEYAKL